MITMLPYWPQEWFVSFKIQPHSRISGWSSIIHLTLGHNQGYQGARCPGIFFSPGETELVVITSFNEDGNYFIYVLQIPLHDMTSVYIEQKSISSPGAHALKVYINGTAVVDVINYNALAFQNVLVYGSDPWYVAADATIRELRIGSP